MKLAITDHISVPSGITATVGANNLLTIKGPKGEVTRGFFDPKIHLSSSNQGLDLHAPEGSRREKKRAYSYSAHIKNMISGVQKPHEYVLKICSGHFPMNITASTTQFSVKNFLGEKIPRILTIPAGVTLKVDADKITVTSTDIELAGQTASRLEHLTRITNKDPRVFQDGIYIIQKPE